MQELIGDVLSVESLDLQSCLKYIIYWATVSVSIFWLDKDEEEGASSVYC